MTDLNLDESLHVQITAIKGDDLGPLQFIFEEAEIIECPPDCECFDTPNYELQDLRGAIFEGEITRGTKTIYILTDDTLIFDEQASSIILSIPSSITSTFTTAPMKISIRQIIEDVVTTRIHGSIVFINT